MNPYRPSIFVGILCSSIQSSSLVLSLEIVTMVTLSPESRMHSCRVVKIVLLSFNDWEEIDFCVLCMLNIICRDSLHPAIPVGVLEFSGL